MEDLAVNETSARILNQRMADNTAVALLCHAPAAVLTTENALGGSPFAGRAMTGFSNDGERSAGLADKAQEPRASYITVDDNLYTGQNPASSQRLAERLVKDLV